MNIQMNTRVATTLVSLKESILPILTAQQKKVVQIVAIIFAALAALATCYWILRYRNTQTKSQDVVKPEQKNQTAQDPIKDPIPEPISVKDPIPDAEKTGSTNTQTKYPDRKSLQEIIWAGDAPISKLVPKNITLREFRDLNDDNQQFMIDEWKFQSTIDSIGRADFFAKLMHVSDRALDLVVMSDLKEDPKTSLLKYALLSEDEIKQISIREVGAATDDQFHQIIRPRFMFIRGAPKDFVEQTNILDFKFIHLRYLTSAKINEFMTEIPPKVLFCLSVDQIKDLDYTQVTKEQIEWIFLKGHSEKRDAFALLTVDQVKAIFDKLNAFQMSLLTDEHIRQLGYTTISKQQLKQLFPERQNYDDQNFKNDQIRFALFSADQINLKLDKISDHHVLLLSDEHLKQLDLAKLNDDQLKTLSFNAKQDRGEVLRRFALFSLDQIRSIFGRLNPYQMNLLSDEHLKQLDVSNLTDQHLKFLFARKVDRQEDLRRFALFSDDQFKAMFSELDDALLSIMSDSHFALLDTLSVPKKRIEWISMLREGNQYP